MDYTPPSGVRAEARRALKWIEEGHAGAGFTDTGRKRASDLARGAAVSRETIGRIANYLARHEGDKSGKGWKPGDEGFPSPGRVAWAAWGGDPAKSWTAGILKSDEDKKSRSGVIMTAPANRNKMVDVPEQRSGATPFEFREDKATGQVLLRGYAATYEPYDCYGGPDAGGWVEQLRADAFDKTLRAQPDVMLLLNHTGAPLARTKSGTLTLSRDRRGLLVEARLDPSDPDVQALLPKMRRGDLDEMSFAFRVKDQEWNDDYTHRHITEVSLQKGDVSVVNYGMNPNTRVAVAEGTVGALAELSNAQLAELRRMDSGLIKRAMSALAQVARSDHDMTDDDEDEDDEKKSDNPFAADDDDEDDKDDKDEKKSGNPFADDGDDEDDDEDEKKSDDGDDDDEKDEKQEEAARALRKTLDRALEIADDDDVRQLLARAKGQLNLMRGVGDKPSDVDLLLESLRSECGIPTSSTVSESAEWLRQQAVVPVRYI